MLSSYERQYITALQNIYNNGFSDGVNERTKLETKQLPGIVFQVDLEKEFPILKSKYVFAKTALREILWIYQVQSSNIHDLQAHIWDSWADPNGSIGEAYGAQIAKPVCIYVDPMHRTPENFRAYRNQTEYVLEYLREFPNGRWANVTLWSVEDLAKMNLVPCCHTATWNLDGGRLNCVLDQRSGDMPYGVPFNTTQYAMLTMLFARDLGVKPGKLTHVIADAHIYANQMEGVEEQLAYYDVLEAMDYNPNAVATLEHKADVAASIHNKREGITDIKDIKKVLYDAEVSLQSCPKFSVESPSTSFFSIAVDDCSVVDYYNMGKIDFCEVAA